jgi:hypothetical protein
MLEDGALGGNAFAESPLSSFWWEGVFYIPGRDRGRRPPRILSSRSAWRI